MAVKSLLTLIKLTKRRLDTLRQEIAAREEEKKTLEDLTISLSQELLREQELAAQNPLVAQSMGAFTKKISKRQESIAQEISRLTQEIDMRQETLRDTFSEQKRYEIAHELEISREKDKLRHAEQQQLDEIGLGQYLRSGDI